MKTLYSVTDISRALHINRSTLYYKPKPLKVETVLFEAVKEAFRIGRQTYGTRRVKVELAKEAMCVSRRKIAKVMLILDLVSVYTKLKKKFTKTEVGHDDTPNIVARKFSDRMPNEVIVSDLTYFPIGNKWYYLCPMLDLCGREVVGYSVGRNKTAELVQQAFHSINADLRKIGLFHSDWGSEFRNKLIDDLLSGFGIKRSLSGKGNPIDNAVIESFNMTIKVEFINRHKFMNIQEFVDRMDDHIKWYNNERTHSSLGYKTPSEYRDAC